MAQIIFNTTNSDKVFDTIAKIVCDAYDESLIFVKSTMRKREIVEPRQVIMYAMKELTNYSLAKIGAHFNGINGQVKDHATVLHALKSISNLMETNKEKKALIESVVSRCHIAIHGEPVITPDQTIIIDKLNGKFITFIGFKQEDVNDLERIIVNNFTK